MLGSEQIGTLITALGTGIRDDFDLAKLRYHRVVIMTDADVDGSHIRTLLLTFFYRHLPAVIENGHLFIAQPPLYRVKRGQKDRYLKDDPALEAWLFDDALEDARLVPDDGEPIAGEALEELVERAKLARSMIQTLARRLPSNLVEAVAMAGGFAEHALDDETTALEVAQRAAAIMGGWQALRSSSGELIFQRQVGERRERHRLDPALARSPEARRLAQALSEAGTLLTVKGRLERKSDSYAVHGPLGFIDRMLELGRKGLTLQRYKGLGEMNPEQLWETTLDPTKRAMIQVKVHHADEADEIFSTLMGDVVEPRRDFIQGNALKVVNLDV